MTQLALFTEQVGTYPHPTPCPIRGECPNNPAGCRGEVGFCTRAQLAAGRWESEFQYYVRTGRRPR